MFCRSFYYTLISSKFIKETDLGLNHESEHIHIFFFDAVDTMNELSVGKFLNWYRNNLQCHDIIRYDDKPIDELESYCSTPAVYKKIFPCNYNDFIPPTGILSAWTKLFSRPNDEAYEIEFPQLNSLMEELYACIGLRFDTIPQDPEYKESTFGPAGRPDFRLDLTFERFLRMKREEIYNNKKDDSKSKVIPSTKLEEEFIHYLYI